MKACQNCGETDEVYMLFNCKLSGELKFDLCFDCLEELKKVVDKFLKHD